MLGEICGESVSKIQLAQCKGIKRIEKQLQREPIFRMTSCMTFNVVVSILAMPWGDSLEVKGPYKSFHRIISAGCLRPRSVAANAASPRPWEKWKPKMDLRTLRRLRTLPRMGWDRHFFGHPKILEIIVGPMLVAWQWSDSIYISVVFQTRSSMLNQVFVGVYPPLGKMFAVMRMFEMD